MTDKLPTEAQKKKRTKSSKTSFVRAQKKIKKDLKIPNDLTSDTHITSDKYLSEAANAIIDRCTTLNDSADGKKTLTSWLVYSTIMSFLPLDVQEEAGEYMDSVLDEYYNVGDVRTPIVPRRK